MTGSSFLSSDAWLLVALLQATREKPFASLAELIAAADGINQAIITRGELETGFGRLVPAGYAMCDGKGYAPTTLIKEFWSKNSGRNKSLFRSWQKLSEFMGAPERHVGPLPTTDDETFVTKQAYEAAISQYY